MCARRNSLLEVRDLKIIFNNNGAGITALRGANFDVGQGEIVGLLGESGCGKSSTALAILGLLPSSARCEGSIRFHGQELRALPEREMEKIRGAEISLISQEPALALNPVLSIRWQVSEVLRAHGKNSGSRSQAEVDVMLERVGLKDVVRIGSAYPHELSGGQRQRVAIAQVLACKPALVIADEPTASLDAVIQAEILDLFLALRQALQCGFLFISHNPAILQRICNRILVMYAGQIVEEGPAARVLTQPLHPYTRALLECAPARPSGPGEKQWSYIPGNPPDMRQMIAGCAFESRCPERMEICTIRAPQELTQETSRHVRCFKYGGS